MILRLHSPFIIHNSQLRLPGSKSETNRLLLLQALYPEISLQNISDADDVLAMRNALQSVSDTIDIGHAGTAMRFLTAYFAIQENRTVTLMGSPRMHERPIGILVDALRQLGARIDYLGAEGFPPLRITGTKLTGSKVTLRADVSSQFLSALLLIAPKLENGLELQLDGEITSRPYLEMTLSLLRKIGVETSFNSQTITVKRTVSVAHCALSVESDWSSASYYYSIVALSEIGTEITLSTFKENSFQGDRALVEIYKDFGVETVFNAGKITIRKAHNSPLSIVHYPLNNVPDLAQTIAVTCLGLGIGCELSGLHTLKIKETDRLLALKNEFEKLGATVVISEDCLTMRPAAIHSNIAIETYHDHRMALAFAPLALKVPIVIQSAEVVSKSYPKFWNDLRRIGFSIAEM
ncbi:3-phosphoshikimate 1-carboxyvinyltransferase [Flavobacterium longum]|uniref:3-phosphoshikimate 1-carboxyvinyltransferase n=1 Tax=Flavobacterium longum TaxID=1299340 RepID=UPI0039E94471